MMTPAIADASLIDGPARTVVLVLGGLACAAFALAWLLCRAAAVADRIEPGWAVELDLNPIASSLIGDLALAWIEAQR